MDMKMEFYRKLPTPKEIKEQFPLTDEIIKTRDERDEVIKNIFEGKDDRLLLIIGPCSADNETSVLDYVSRLKKVADKVEDRIFIIPRVYTNKPRTTGLGYKGMLHSPNPEDHEDMLKGIIAIRDLHTKVVAETGFTSAEEMLYPENHRYLSDLLAYIAIGARSVENQQHRIVASGAGLPAGMKNPTAGYLTVMMNSITAAQNSHTFLYRGWEAKTVGNPLAHAILRGYVDKYGRSHPNYHYEDLLDVAALYEEHSDLVNPAVIVDCNHNNSGKKYIEQIRIAKEVIASRNHNNDIKKLVKGLMIESYIEDGNQKIGEGVYGKSITDPCLGWEKTERLIYELADLWR